jgi:hypothetical protein
MTTTRTDGAQKLTAGAFTASGFLTTSEYDFFAVVSCRVGFEDEYQLVILASVSEGMLWGC